MVGDSMARVKCPSWQRSAASWARRGTRPGGQDGEPQEHRGPANPVHGCPGCSENTSLLRIPEYSFVNGIEHTRFSLSKPPKQLPAAPFKPATATCHTISHPEAGVCRHTASNAGPAKSFHCNISTQQIKEDGLSQSDQH